MKPNEILFVPSVKTENQFICTINTETKTVRPLKWQPAKNKKITSFLALESTFVLRMRDVLLKSSFFRETIHSTCIVNSITEKLEFTEQSRSND